MTATTQATTTWELTGEGWEFCNCNPGCTCNFAGFPSSKDGSCKAIVVDRIRTGRCGEVDLSGLDVGCLFDWPKAVHDGGGKAVFVVPPAASDEQVDCLMQILSGALGGMPWEIFGTTYEVAGLVRADTHFEGEGLDAGFTIPGVGQARGTTLKNPVTGEPHRASILLDEGFIWTRGDCGQGSFTVSAEGIDLDFKDSNWIRYDFDWTNAG
ncbi:MAG TPA: DUF1326 domain-containing protein [Mycobacteriales bacterium]|nr:DUF1326 domain-containing protein [Mycobacteriales bacterium]